MIETLKKELLPGMMVFDLRTTLEEISNSSETDVSMEMCFKKERHEDCTGGACTSEILVTSENALRTTFTHHQESLYPSIISSLTQYLGDNAHPEENWKGTKGLLKLKFLTILAGVIGLKCPCCQQGFCGFGISVTSKNVLQRKKINSDAFFCYEIKPEISRFGHAQ